MNELNLTNCTDGELIAASNIALVDYQIGGSMTHRDRCAGAVIKELDRRAQIRERNATTGDPFLLGRIEQAEKDLSICKDEAQIEPSKPVFICANRIEQEIEKLRRGGPARKAGR